MGSQKIHIVIFTLLQWSKTKSAMSLRYACTHTHIYILYINLKTQISYIFYNEKLFQVWFTEWNNNYEDNGIKTKTKHFMAHTMCQVLLFLINLV